MYANNVGWWLEEEGYDNLLDACGSLAELLANGQWSGGAIVSGGAFPAPMCEQCLTEQELAQMRDLDTSKKFLDDPDWTTERALLLLDEVVALRGANAKLLKAYMVILKALRELVADGMVPTIS
jgi:hypothetical protein